MPSGGRAEDGRTGDKLGLNSRSRAEKRLERAQEETGGKGDCTEGERAGRREEGCALLSRARIERRTVAKERPFKREEAQGLTVGGGDRDIIPGLEVQSSFFD